MTSRHPLAAAAGIAALAAVAGAIGLTTLLAVLGYTSVDSDVAPATGWDGEYGSASGSQGAPGPTPDDATAVGLLDRATTAARTVPYRGVTLTGGNGIDEPVATTVTGVPGVGTVVQSPWGAVVLAGQGRSASLADASRVLDLLVANFHVRLAPDRSVAGRPASGVMAYRADGTAAARFWFDEATGLLLRRDLLGRSGDVVSSTWYSELRVGAAPVSRLPPYAVDAWSHVLDADQRSAWRSAGCRCAESLPDGMSLLEARTDDAGAAAGPGRGVVHLLYSDGLSELSVFEQTGTMDVQGTDALAAQGFESVTYAGVPVMRRALPAAGAGAWLATGEWVWVCGPSVVTVVAPSVPHAAAERRVERLVAAYAQADGAWARSPAEDGVLGAVRRGWARATHALSESWDHLRSSSAPSQVDGVGSGHEFRAAATADRQH